MDKTGFCISCGKIKLVVIIDLNNFCIVDPKNHDHIISVKYIGSINLKTILLMLLVFKINILYKWYQHNDLDRDIVISITKTGYINNNITLK